MLNLEACGYMTASYEAWAQMPKLVKYLPAGEAEEEDSPEAEAGAAGEAEADPVDGGETSAPEETE